MKKISAKDIASKLGISKPRAIEALLKTQLIAAVIRGTEKQKLTHAELAERAGLPRSAVTGIISGSLQHVTLDRILKLVDALGYTAEIKLKKSA